MGSSPTFGTNTVIKRSGIRRGLNSLSWVEKRNTSLPVTKPRCVIFCVACLISVVGSNPTITANKQFSRMFAIK